MVNHLLMEMGLTSGYELGQSELKSERMNRLYKLTLVPCGSWNVQENIP